MACPVDPGMEIKATTNAKWYGAPAPLFCAPKSKMPFTGYVLHLIVASVLPWVRQLIFDAHICRYWDHSVECNKPWANPPEHCKEYKDQKAGAFNNSAPKANSSGRTDVEGCCFWGKISLHI